MFEFLRWIFEDTGRAFSFIILCGVVLVILDNMVCNIASAIASRGRKDNDEEEE